MLRTSPIRQYILVRRYGRYRTMNLRDETQVKKHRLFDTRIHEHESPSPIKLLLDQPVTPVVSIKSFVKDASLVRIAPRIERGPTDILKALASTIGTDFTAPHYKFHDDPYLTPVSNLTKRSYSLSKEAGRKAAKWVRQQHSDLFQHKVASPPVEVFYPTPIITEETDVNEPLLQSLIRQGLISDCKKVYGMLKDKKIEVGRDTKQSLLELLAYYNETDPVDEELTEERWYRAGNLGRERQKNTWKEYGLAEQLFVELEPQDVSAYCAMIRGRAKYYQVEKAWHLYNEAQSKGMIVDTETFNCLIRVVNFARENSDLRWQLVEELLTTMEKAGLTPNIGTLNSTLEAISTIGHSRHAKTVALQTLAEFKNLGIQPSLASYYYVLIIHCKERGPVNTILNDILQEIQGQAFTIQDPKDTFFFVTAMDVCRNHLQNLDLAVKVDALLHTANNYDLVGDSYKESIYYRHLMALKCNMESFEVFMKFYDKIVPNIYTPEPGIMEAAEFHFKKIYFLVGQLKRGYLPVFGWATDAEILKSLELNGTIQYLPRIWSDLVIFDQSLRENLVSRTLQIMANNMPEDEASELAVKFVCIGASIWKLIESQDPERGRKTLWSGKMLGDLMTVYVKGAAYNEASDVLKKLLQRSQEVLGVPDVRALKAYLKYSIKEMDSAMCLATIQYTSDCGFADVVEMADETYARVKLDSIQISRLSNIVGFDITAEKPDSAKVKSTSTSSAT